MKLYAEVENRASYDSVGTGLDKLDGGRTKFALFLALLSIGNMWRTNTLGWKVRMQLRELNIHIYPSQFCHQLCVCVWRCVCV